MTRLSTCPARGARLRKLPWLACLLLLGGCAQLQALKSRVAHGLGSAPATAASAPAASPRTAAPSPPNRSLPPPLPPATVVARELQYGHYQAARSDLQRYLRLHPGDHAANALLRQLTVDPVKALGTRSTPHVVQPGESYSSLAQHYLGNASRFVILARYNHASDPSKLRAGQTVQLPDSARHVDGAQAHGDVETRHPVAAAADGAARARQLQTQSETLLARGHRQQALERLGEALRIDPQLPAAGSSSETLRKQLLASYHQQAIVLYRDQHLDRAIALWDRILAIDPHYESARVYRARALELKQRLQQLQ